MRLFLYRSFHILLYSLSFLCSDVNAQNSIPPVAEDKLNFEDSPELIQCFDYSRIKENAAWAKDPVKSRTFVGKCDWSMSYLVLNPDSTFACVIRTEKANWLQAGHWRVSSNTNMEFENDDALSEDFLCSFNNKKANAYTVAHIVAASYVFKQNHLIPVTTFSIPAETSKIQPIREEDTELRQVSVSGTFLHGPVKKPLAGTLVNLRNKNNEILQTTRTNIFGTFLFNNVPFKEDYFLTLQPEGQEIEKEEITFVSKTGKTIGVSNRKMGFRYAVLAGDNNMLSQINADDTQLKIAIHGRLFLDAKGSMPLSHALVSLLNHKGQVSQKFVTDSSGLFKFSHKINKENYVISLNDSVIPVGRKKEIFLADDKGVVLQKLVAANGQFRYEILPLMQSTMTEIVLDDPWLEILDLGGSEKINRVIVENIHYEVNDWNLTPEARIILDKVILVLKNKPFLKLELSSHTDSRGSDEANLVLSRKRASTGMQYIVSQGISAGRVSAKGYGETRLLNKCGNGVLCTEEEHRKNRRAEFTVIH